MTAEPATIDSRSELTAVLVALADGNFRGYSPIYERIARCWAADDELLDRVDGLVDPVTLPVILLAAVHDITLREPELELAAIYRGEHCDTDPWPPFRELVASRLAELTTTLRERTIQTNEVGRSAVLIPALAWLADALGGRPMALVELGPSAGLNLLLDRYRVDYDDGRSAGDPRSSVHLRCSLLGPNRPPLPEGSLPIERREGIDLAPVDVHDPEATRWLEACLWPGVTARAQRLRGALEIARVNPPLLHAGDAAETLGPVLDSIPIDLVPVVFSTWAIAYLSPEGRHAVHDSVAERGASRDIALLSAEYPHVMDWVPVPRPPMVEQGTDATLVGVSLWQDGAEHARPLGWMQAHGDWLHWLGEHDARDASDGAEPSSAEPSP